MLKRDLKALKYALAYNSRVTNVGVTPVRIAEITTELLEKVIRYVEAGICEAPDKENERPE